MSEKQEPMKRIFELSKMHRKMQNFVEDKYATGLSNLDIRLLKGFYITDKWELDDL